MTPDVDGFDSGFQFQPVEVETFPGIPSLSKNLYTAKPSPIEVSPPVEVPEFAPGRNFKPVNLPRGYAGRVTGFGWAAIIAILAELAALAETHATTERARRAVNKGCDCCRVVGEIIEAEIVNLPQRVKRKALRTKVNTPRHYRTTSIRRRS